MKKFLLLLLILITVKSKAQHKEVDSLLNELKKHPQEDTVRMNLLNRIAFGYNIFNPAEGVKMSDSAIQLAGRLHHKQGLATGLLNKGINHNYIENDSITLQLYNQALQIAQQSGFKPLMANIYHDIGTYFFDKSDYSKAIEFQQKSLVLAATIHDSSLIGNDYVTIGNVYHSLSNYSEAIDYELKALKIFNTTNNKTGIATAYTNLGLTYFHLEQFSKALDYHEKAFEIQNQLGAKRQMANALANEADVYDNLDDSAKALRLYHQALAICEEINYKQGITNNNANIGILYSYYPLCNKAVPYLMKALQFYKRMNDKNNEALILTRLADAYNNASAKDLRQLRISPHRRFAIALGYNNEADVLAKEIKSTVRQAEAISGISETYEKEEDYKNAFDYYKKADTLNKSILNDASTKSITRLEMRYDFDKQQDSSKAIADKQQALSKAEIQKQHIIENATMAGASFLILTGIGSFLFYKRNRNIRAQKNEAVLKSQITDTEMKALRAQMNPHFIFNSLNSIADYIDKNQTKMASDFTVKFARLMRMVLENSEDKEIPLAKDLEALELYMQLESFRLQNKFEYHIQVDENIDTENILVPPLILQPFIENSIKHGLPRKEGKGHLTIRIQQAGNMLSCIVEDDGEGMKQTADPEHRKSLGMKITRARIDIINQRKNAGASMNVSNKEKGVRAEVILPLELSF